MADDIEFIPPTGEIVATHYAIPGVTDGFVPLPETPGADAALLALLDDQLSPISHAECRQVAARLRARADEVERLRLAYDDMERAGDAQIAALRTRAERAEAEVERLTRERDRAREVGLHHFMARLKGEDERDAERTARERAEAALRRIADPNDKLDGHHFADAFARAALAGEGREDG